MLCLCFSNASKLEQSQNQGIMPIALNSSLRLGRCHFLFSCDTVWAVFFAGSAAVLLDGTFTFHPHNAMIMMVVQEFQ